MQELNTIRTAPRILKKVFVVLCFFLSGIDGFAQECAYFPADCPRDFSPMLDSLHCIGDFIVPQEITMQNRLRELTGGMMQKIADAKKWEMYEYDETGYGDFINPFTSPAYAVPFPNRKPHQYIISFIFIVNADSLKAWENWTRQDLVDDANKISAQYNQQMDDPALQEAQKRNMDSVNYWTEAQSAYMTSHMAAYQKALTSKDEAGIKNYENALSLFQKKIDYWINIINRKTSDAYAGADKSHEQFQKSMHDKKIMFRNSSMIRIKFSFNERAISPYGGGTPVFIKKISVPGAALAGMYHNSAPDEQAIFDLNQFHRSPDIYFLLFGKWKIPADPVFDHQPAFILDKENSNFASVKRITCEKVQTIAVHIEGSPAYLESFIRLFDGQMVHDLVVKE